MVQDFLPSTSTPLKISMEPQNEGLEDYFPFQRAVFQVPSLFSGEYQLV